MNECRTERPWARVAGRSIPRNIKAEMGDDMIRVMLAGVTIVLSTSAIAQDRPIPALYGLTLLQPISLPECAADAKAVEKYRKAAAKYPSLSLHYPYGVNKSGPCYKRDDRHAGAPNQPQNESVRIDFPMSALPEGASWDSVYATIIDGKVQAIGFNTYGLVSQQLVFDQLKGKFGTPDTNDIVTKQNGYGTKFDSIKAGWSLGDGVIASFEGTGLRTDYGIFSLSTETARAREAEHLKKLTSGTAM